jgi:hypothetical protein
MQLPEKYKENFNISSDGQFVGKLVTLLLLTSRRRAFTQNLKVFLKVFR